MSVFEDIKNGLLQAITFEKERKAIRSHFERSKKDIKDGRVLLAEEAIESVADELISFSCLNENGRGRSQTTTGTKKNNKKSEKALSQADFPKNPVISFSVLRAISERALLVPIFLQKPELCSPARLQTLSRRCAVAASSLRAQA